MASASIGRSVGSRVTNTRLGSLGRIGFGCYRIFDVPDHLQLLETALVADAKKRINLVDTSANYGDGQSETVVGKVISKLSLEARKQLCIVSKAGYIQGSNLQRYQSQKSSSATHPPEVVEYSSQCLHSIHPDFVEDQLQRSLQRLQTSYVDLYLLHNPEYFLMKANSDSPQKLEEARAEMFRRIHAAFERLETQVKAGRIRSYGISSNTFSVSEDDPHFLPYSGLLELSSRAAKSVGNASPGLAGLQMPGNLLEREGLEGCAKWASSNGLAVLINRPLNAFERGGQEWRLADYPALRPHDYNNAFNIVIDQARAKVEQIDEDIKKSPQRSSKLQPLRDTYAFMLSLLRDLASQVESFVSPMHYEDDLHTAILPTLQNLIRNMYGSGAPEEDIQEMVSKFQLLLAVYGQEVRVRTSQSARRHLKDKGLLPPNTDETPLQDVALNFLLDNPNVSVALLGITREEYLNDAFKILDDRSSK